MGGQSVSLPSGGWHFEDFVVGDKCETMSRTVSEGELTTFVGLTGFFEEFFISAPVASKDTLFGRRFIPGQLTFIVAEGLYVLTGRMHNGLALLGLTDMRWSAVVACGDTIRAHVTVESTRPTSTAGRGIVTTMHRVQNQNSDEVLSYRTTRMIRGRS
jgi:acyl dehydratase